MKAMGRGAIPIWLAAGLCLGFAGMQQKAVPDKPASFTMDVRPLLQKYCAPCHAGAEAPAGVDLAAIKSNAHAEKATGLLARAVANLEAGIMPPAGSPRPTAVESKRLVSAMRSLIASAPTPPGRVTLRRLNRFEYANSVRDLLGVEWNPTEDFPSDDVGYGFDNIGDVLSVSPLLVEKYLDAAETLAERAIAAPKSLNRRYDLTDLAIEGGVREADGALAFYSNGTARKIISIEHPGDYLIRATAFATQAGNEPAKLAILVGSRKPEPFEVKSPRSNPGTYELPVTLEKGAITLGVSFPNDFYDPQNPNPERRDRNLIVIGFELDGPIGQKEPVSASQLRLLPNRNSSESDENYRRRVVGAFAERAFRRPATEDEIRKLTSLMASAEKDGQTTAHAFRLVIRAVLASPKFLFRPELDIGKGQVRLLNDFEIASRLSYFLWGSIPDDDLYKAARSGQLSTPEGRRAQTLRLLAHPRSRALADGFAAQWLQLRKLDTFQPDAKQFPAFDEELRLAMREETLAGFDNLRRENRSVIELLTSGRTFVNEVLARHYGLKGVTGPQMRAVKWSDPNRGGILTHASVLTVTSNPTRTSPTKRGRWVLEQILGTPPPPPPPGADNLNETNKKMAGLSLRKKMEVHRSNPDCASCHARMDPLGFGLENFDPIGRWRVRDPDGPVDSSGILPGGRKFTGPRELRAILLEQKPLFVRNLADKLLTYAIGRGTKPEDRPVIERIARRAEQNGYKFASLILGIVESDPFLKQSGGSRP